MALHICASLGSVFIVFLMGKLILTYLFTGLVLVRLAVSKIKPTIRGQMFTTVRNPTNGTSGSIVLNQGCKLQSLCTVIGRSKVSQDRTGKWVRTVGKWREQLPLGLLCAGPLSKTWYKMVAHGYICPADVLCLVHAVL